MSFDSQRGKLAAHRDGEGGDGVNRCFGRVGKIEFKSMRIERFKEFFEHGWVLVFLGCVADEVHVIHESRDNGVMLKFCSEGSKDVGDGECKDEG